MFTGIIIIFIFIFLIIKCGVTKAFILFFAYNILDKGLSLIGPLMVKDVILLIFLSLFFIHRQKYQGKYALLSCSLISIFSYFISTSFSSNPHWPVTILNCLRYFAIPFLLFHFLQSSKDIAYFIKVTLYTSILITIYSLIELKLGTSPIINFINVHNGNGYNLDDTYRYGLKRVQAVFVHATSLGYYSVTIISFLLLFLRNRQTMIRYNINLNIYIITIIGLTICTFLSGTRSAIFPLFCIYIYTLRTYIFKFKSLVIVTFILFCLYIIASEYFNEYLVTVTKSILDTNDSSIGGSTDDMRSRQFEIAIEYWSNSPIIGFGTGKTFEEVTVQNPDMYGAESIWMPLLIDNGILGCIAYFLCYINSFFYVKKELLNTLLFLAILLLMNTTTSVPGLNISLILSFTIVIKYILYDKIQHYRCSIQH